MTGALEGHHSPALLEVLGEARRAGYLGPGPLDVHLRHGEGFAVVARDLWAPGATTDLRRTKPRLVDLGSGGGVPGLVVAQAWPEADLVLLEASRRRAAFLRRAVERLGLGTRVEVTEQRAEQFGREPGRRGCFDGALARSFGKPAVVAECAAPLLQPGAWLVVSEPPGDAGKAGPEGQDGPHGPADSERWPAEALRGFGLEPVGPVRVEFVYQRLRQVSRCPERYPRRNGVPAKKPLF